MFGLYGNEVLYVLNGNITLIIYYKDQIGHEFNYDVDLA